ncbi:hypothetical protein Sbal625DRAFT_0054 [Shewanella baltica OS625]|nr:hypothetical protein Sbal678_3538 [Shewanella baltica OS678]EHC07722.1 hypothetical protein Sbal625DRAFT_0054 [Shewanella baltica OS625]SUI44669.1 Uncharacterised protein [Shewanella baltica]
MRRLSLANTLSQMDYLALMRIGYTLVVSVPVSQSDHSDRFRQVAVFRFGGIKLWHTISMLMSWTP